MLRSINQLKGDTIDATDGDIGKVSDVYFDDEEWVFRYLVVDTRNWWFGHSVLVAPQWIDGIDWASAKVSVRLSRDAIKKAPEYDPSQPPDAEFEQRLEQHYQQQNARLANDQA